MTLDAFSKCFSFRLTMFVWWCRKKHIWPLAFAKHNSDGGRQYGFYSSSQNKFELNVMKTSTGVIVWLLLWLWPLTPTCLSKIKITQSHGAMIFFSWYQWNAKLGDKTQTHHMSCVTITLFGGFKSRFMSFPTMRFVIHFIPVSLTSLFLWESRHNYPLICLYLLNRPHKACFTQLQCISAK